MSEPQAEVNAPMITRNLNAPMTLLPGAEQLDCAQLAAELAKDRRHLNAFARLIGVVEEQRSQLSAKIATTEATRIQRANAREAAVRRVSTDKEALDACLLHGIGMEHGECTRQEEFLRRSEDELSAAGAALSAVEASLQALQNSASEINRDLVSLNADHQDIQGEIDQILSIMEGKSCPIAA
jgi:predicted  nucleic acid-binding Zn-ribbon protein